MRILLAEDDPLLGDGLRAGLRQLGFQVDWVRDGRAAERELRAQPYAAAVLDLGLPFMDGIDVLAAARKAGVSVPVLVTGVGHASSGRRPSDFRVSRPPTLVPQRPVVIE